MSTEGEATFIRLVSFDLQHIMLWQCWESGNVGYLPLPSPFCAENPPTNLLFTPHHYF